MIKQILTKEEEAKKRQRNQLIVVGILILIMLLSTMGFALNGDSNGSSANKAEYKGITFIKDENEYWRFQSNGNDFTSRLNPLELNGTEVSIRFSLADYKNKPLYIDGVEDESVMEITRNLYPFVQRIQKACLSGNCTGDLPVKNCTEDNIISVREPLEGEDERAYQEENCAFIIASYANQTRYADAFLFKVLGI